MIYVDVCVPVWEMGKLDRVTSHFENVVFEQKSVGSQGAICEDIWRKGITARRITSAEILSEKQGYGSEQRLLSLRYNELKRKQEDMKSEGEWKWKGRLMGHLEIGATASYFNRTSLTVLLFCTRAKVGRPVRKLQQSLR